MLRIFASILDALLGPSRPEGRHPDQSQPIPSNSASKPSNAGHYEKTHTTKTFNDNLAHAQNPHYIALREKADEVGAQMGKLFGQSRLAFEAGNGAEAKRLSDQAKALRAEKDRLHREAADWIFDQNNTARDREEIDLHGLRAEEAVERTEARIIEARRSNLPELKVIVGKGRHSQNRQAVLKPRIQKLMHEHDLIAEVDPQNDGVLIVHFDKRTVRGRIVDSDEIISERCVVM